MPLRRTIAAVTVLYLVAAPGCGRPAMDRSPLAPVTGTVTFKGQPLPAGEIILQPAKGKPAHGIIENGQITHVHTYDADDGAPVGDLQVAVFANEPDTSDPAGMAVTSLIPTKYNDSATSGLTAKIEAGHENQLEFDLTE